MQQLKELVKQGKAEETEARVRELLKAGTTPEALMREAMIPAMEEVGNLFQEGEYFLPEMLLAARAMQRGMELLKPILVSSGSGFQGKVVLGTVQGDIHDIGKNLVAMTLEGAGFEVIDLGVDVPPERFVEAVKEYAPQVLGMSALLTTTMLSMKETLDHLRKEGLRDRVKVMIGGAAVRQEFAVEIGADFYGPDSTAARDFVRRVVESAG
ncbi:corrinoid protein [Candidatus Solincola sp.]|jgi:5-methyltetrahydrofolate--homocysteine methyltransferase|nr:corrinoid protein [Actinomycetota bacterium]MDI7251387.1 corrinoid protein [Actinomycetota bacterium]